MKKLIAILALIMCLFSAFSEEIPVEEKALPLYEILLSAPSFTSFKEAPEAELSFEAIEIFRKFLVTPGEALTDEEIYKMLFSVGEFMPFDGEEEAFEILPVRVTIESAVESGVGTIIVSVRSEKDYGFGFEFDMYADFHIVPDENAPFGARIARVFIPE